MRHKDKVKLARKLYTKADKDMRWGLFDSYAWKRRSEAIASRVKRQQDAAHKRALERKAKAKQHD